MAVNYEKMVDEQRKIQESITNGQEEKEKKKVLSLSMTESDKLALQQYALKNGKSAAQVIHEWIQEHIINE